MKTGRLGVKAKNLDWLQQDVFLSTCLIVLSATKEEK